MLNSRDISLLREDVAANCRALLARAAAQGLSVLVTNTVRDAEYQEKCFANGTAKTKIPSFHAVEAGLAFDVCKNVKGHEYDDAAFFEAVGALGKELGFTWGGDWRDFPDRPHFQWDAHGAYTSAMVRAGQYPPKMPAAGDLSEKVLQEDGAQASKNEPSAWSAKAREWAEKEGIFQGDGAGEMHYAEAVTREQLAVVLQRFAARFGAKKDE